MNVNDQWMLERMQQMAAGMATPQAAQNADTPKTRQGERFQDLMNKAKDRNADAARKDKGSGKTENAQKGEPAQAERASQTDQTSQTDQATQTQAAQTQAAQTDPASQSDPAIQMVPAGQTVQKTRKAVQIDPETGLRQIDVTAEEAALLVAGYAKLSPPMEDGTVWMVTVRDAEGNPIPPLAAPEDMDVLMAPGMPALTQGEWVLDEITPEFTQALEQLLQRTGDPRSAEDLIGELKQKIVDLTLAPEMKLTVVKTGGEMESELGSQVMTAGQPLFREVEAAPVKVGENFQLDTQDADMDANLADTIRFAARQGLQQIEIKLSPENLGSLTVKLTQAADGTVQVVLHATNLKAANLLNQHLGDLNAALQGHGQSSAIRVEVQRGEDSQQARQQQQQADPNGHNQQQRQEQQRRQEEGEHSGDFVQRLRLGLFGAEETL